MTETNPVNQTDSNTIDLTDDMDEDDHDDSETWAYVEEGAKGVYFKNGERMESDVIVVV